MQLQFVFACSVRTDGVEEGWLNFLTGGAKVGYEMWRGGIRSRNMEDGVFW